MRDISFVLDYVKFPAGSCLVSFGGTRVLCTVTIEESVPPFLEGTGKGWLSAEYAMLPGSTPGSRKRREIGKRDGRSTEIQRLIGRSLRAAVKLDALGPRSLIIDCDVIQADGGTRTAAISGAWVALARAMQKHPGLDPDQLLTGQMAAVSVGLVDGKVVGDLDYSLDRRAEVDMNVVMLGYNLVEVQGTGENGVFDRTQLDALLDRAEKEIIEIYAAQRSAIEGT